MPAVSRIPKSESVIELSIIDKRLYNLNQFLLAGTFDLRHWATDFLFPKDMIIKDLEDERQMAVLRVKNSTGHKQGIEIFETCTG